MRRYMVFGLGILLGLAVARGGEDLTATPESPAGPAAPATQSADSLSERIVTWIRQLGEDGLDVREAAQKELMQNGGAALEPLLRARAGGNPERTRRAEEVLNVLRTRICLAAMREVIQWEIAACEKETARYQKARDDEGIRAAILRKQEELKTLREQAAPYAKMTPTEYVLPAPVHLEVYVNQTPSPTWVRSDIGEGLTAWKLPAVGRGEPRGNQSWLMCHVGQSRSGPFYRAVASATTIPEALRQKAAMRLAMAVYPLFQSAYPFPEHYVYVERRDYPTYSNASQRIDDLLKMPKHFGAWAETAEELAKLARTDPSTRPVLRKLAIPALREAIKVEHSSPYIQAAIQDAIEAIERDIQPATQPAAKPAPPTIPPGATDKP